MLLDDVCRIGGGGGGREWLNEFGRVDKVGKVALLLRKEVDRVCN